MRVEDINRKRAVKSIAINILFAVLAFLAFLISMNWGEMSLPPVDVLQTLFGEGTKTQETVLFYFRLPRIVMAVLVGVGLAVSGAILQGISRNELADPGILGINAGAGLAVVVYISLVSGGMETSPFLMPFMALIGGFITAILIYLLSYKKGEGISPTRLILSGIALAMGISAITVIITLHFNPDEYEAMMRWSLGSLSTSDWQHILALVPWIVILTPFVFYRSKELNTLGLNESIAKGLGLAVEGQRIILLAAAVALAASAVAVGGAIGFVGLISPHLARKIVGPKHQHMLPVTAMVGALLVLVADTLARNIMNSEIPAGIIVTLLGAPYFLYLLMKAKS